MQVLRTDLVEDDVNTVGSGMAYVRYVSIGQNKRGDGGETTACPLRKQSDTIASPDTCAGESDAGRTDSSQIRHHSTLWGKCLLNIIVIES